VVKIVVSRHVLPLALKSLRENYPLQIQSRRAFSELVEGEG
jgi:hypothetical protein